MNYKRVVTERAEEQLDRILRYLLERFHSKQAARALMEDVERTMQNWNIWQGRCSCARIRF